MVAQHNITQQLAPDSSRCTGCHGLNFPGCVFALTIVTSMSVLFSPSALVLLAVNLIYSLSCRASNNIILKVTARNPEKKQRTKNSAALLAQDQCCCCILLFLFAQSTGRYCLLIRKLPLIPTKHENSKEEKEKRNKKEHNM